MALILIGSVNAATDATMATITNRPSSLFRGALEDLIAAVASAIIAANPTLIAAAEAALSDAMDDWGIYVTEAMPEYLFAFHDAGGKLTDLRVRASDGHFPDDVVRSIGLRLSGTSAGATASAGFALLWARLAVAKADALPCPLVFAGSSTTANNGVSAPLGYVNQFVAAAQEKWPNGGVESETQTSNSATFVPVTGPGVHGYNAGEGGATALNYLTDSESEAIAALNPAMIMHMVGSNDFKQQRSLATYKQNILDRIAYLDARMAMPCLHVLVHPYQRMDVVSAGVPWGSYGEVLRQVAEEVPNAVMVDISAEYEAVGVPGSDPLVILRPDQVHQHERGYRFMADLLIDRILG